MPKVFERTGIFHKFLLVIQVFDIFCDGYTVEPQLATSSLSGPLQCGPKQFTNVMQCIISK